MIRYVGYPFALPVENGDSCCLVSMGAGDTEGLLDLSVCVVEGPYCAHFGTSLLLSFPSELAGRTNNSGLSLWWLV